VFRFAVSAICAPCRAALTAASALPASALPSSALLSSGVLAHDGARR
jgi:hypothetical protein